MREIVVMTGLIVFLFVGVIDYLLCRGSSAGDEEEEWECEGQEQFLREYLEREKKKAS